MPPQATPPVAPSLDADRVLALAARSMFDVFAKSAMGTLVIDRQHRIVWISEGYKRFLPALGQAMRSSVAKWLQGEVAAAPKYRRGSMPSKLDGLEEAIKQALKGGCAAAEARVAEGAGAACRDQGRGL